MMRGSILAALLFLVATCSPAVAQGPAFEVEIGPVPLLAGSNATATTDATVRVPCTHATAGVARPEPHIEVWYLVEGAPHWAMAVTEPPSDMAPLTACEGGIATFHPEVRLSGPALAPAGPAGSITLRAFTSGIGPDAAPAEAVSNAVAIEVAHVVDVQLLPPREHELWLGYGGELTWLTLSFVNFGNSDVGLTFSDLRIEPDVPIALMGSVNVPAGLLPEHERPRGGIPTIARFDVGAPQVDVEASGPTTYRFTATWTARPVHAPDAAGRSGSVDVTVTVGPPREAGDAGNEASELSQVPSSAPLLVVLAAVLTALRRRAT